MPRTMLENVAAPSPPLVTTVAVIWAPGESPVFAIFACIARTLKVSLPLSGRGENEYVILFPDMIAVGAIVKPLPPDNEPGETTVAVLGESVTETVDGAEVVEQDRETEPMTLELPPTEMELTLTEQLCAEAAGPPAKPISIAVANTNVARLNRPIRIIIN